MATGLRGCACGADDLHRRLSQSRMVRRALREFRRATGLAARLVPAALPIRVLSFGSGENEFCQAVGCNCKGCRACYQTQLKLLLRVSHKLKPHQVGCIGGLVQLAVPIIVAGRHVATLLGGKVRVRRAGAARFEAVARQLRRWGARGCLRRLRAAYYRVPVFTADRLRAAVRLLDVLGRLFSEAIAQQPAPRSSSDPPCVAEAKQFIRLHFGERLTTRQVAEALHLSDAYFCRLFRRFAGTTFHAYVARVRVEAGQAALLNTAQRVGEIGMAAGFQSISDFNRVFKASVGMSPSEFRRKRQGTDPGL